MTLKSALNDVRETDLAAVSGLLAKLAYLASLRHKDGGYKHWGMSLVHGEDSSDKALKTAHSEVLSKCSADADVSAGGRLESFE